MSRAKKPKPGVTYLMRTCAADMTAHGGFRWPESGLVECPDWDPAPTCGHGLHGLLMGAGDGSLLDWSPAAKWLVVEVDAAVVVEIAGGGKVKVPGGIVVYCGERGGAVDYLLAKGADAGRCQAAPSSSTGDWATSSSTGYGATSSSTGYGATSSSTGSRATSSSTGERGLALGADKVAAGALGTIIARWWDGKASRYRYTIGYVGEGIEPFFWYSLDAVGAWRKGEPLPDSLLSPAQAASRKAVSA